MMQVCRTVAGFRGRIFKHSRFHFQLSYVNYRLIQLTSDHNNQLNTVTMSLQVNNDEFTLNDGSKIPAVGLGTWRASEKGAAFNAVKVALENGYRHIDTAAIYGNEKEVGEGIKASGVPRSEIYVTTKLWNSDHDDVEKALDISLEKLGLEYVDLYLIHWPVSAHGGEKAKKDEYDYLETYKKIQKLVKTGKVKSVGISNFTQKKVEKLLADKDVTVKPVVNQIEAHPLLPQEELKDYLTKQGILIEAYSPLGSDNSPLFKNETIVAIAEKNKVEPAQILISWAVQRGTVVLPKSVTDSRIISNLKTIKLSDEDFDTLNKLSEKDGVVRTCDPQWDVFSSDE